MVFEIIRRQPVGDVQREIPYAAVVRKEFQMIIVADQIAIRIAGAHLVQRPFLAHFENARRSHENGRMRSAHAFASL